jgi:hypothetical protein
MMKLPAICKPSRYLIEVIKDIKVCNWEFVSSTIVGSFWKAKSV